MLRDFNAKLDPVVVMFISMSEFLRANGAALGVGLVLIVVAFWLMLRRPGTRAAFVTQLSRLPLIKPILTYHRTTLFCRNLGVLLASAVPLTTTLRILVDMMATTSDRTVWTRMVERVRHGGKLSDALTDTAALPVMAVRMLRLGEIVRRRRPDVGNGLEWQEHRGILGKTQSPESPGRYADDRRQPLANPY